MKLDRLFCPLPEIHFAKIYKLIKFYVSLPDDYKWRFLQIIHDYIIWATIF